MVSVFIIYINPTNFSRQRNPEKNHPEIKKNQENSKKIKLIFIWNYLFYEIFAEKLFPFFFRYLKKSLPELVSRIFCQVLFTSFLLRTFLNIFIQTCLRLFWHQRISDSSLRSRDIARQTDRQTYKQKEYCILVVGWLKLINKELMTSSVAQVKDCIGTDNPTPEAKLRNDHLSFSWASHAILSWKYVCTGCPCRRVRSGCAPKLFSQMLPRWGLAKRPTLVLKIYYKKLKIKTKQNVKKLKQNKMLKNQLQR